MKILVILEVAAAGAAGEGDRVADVIDAGDELHEPFEAEAEAAMGDGAIFAQIEVPLVGCGVEAARLILGYDNLVTATTDDFTDLGTNRSRAATFFP